ncbi:NUDIX hydrolase [Mesobacillus thioparans]|uniref:NUDIX hydrolase n=1 Tax=Mesobacillus thioparans TaxID=370439 RepID=UPI0039EFBF1C
MASPQNNGFELIECIQMSELEMEHVHPMAGSFAIIEMEGEYLLGYNSLRRQWELPAGKREENETPLECAKRELFEETGQIVESLQLIGVARVKNLKTKAEKLNPIYFSTIYSLMPFTQNEETTEVKLWDLKEEIKIDQLDLAILQSMIPIQ